MGAVYEARHVQTQKRCAVKVLRAPELSGDAESVKRFFREARASGLIECPNVVSALDSGVDRDGRAYYVMEYLSGEDLAQLLGRIGLLTPSAGIKVGAQAARGLASAHALHILHRDIKPANLFLARTGGDEVTVKLLDFGVAKVRADLFEESAGAPTQSGSLLGTLQYMSPAQLRRASAIDETADLWSLGVLLYECLTGELPWSKTDGIGELVTAILTSPVPRIQERAPWVPTALARVVERATARDERERFSSAREFADALEALASGETALTSSELVAPTEGERQVALEPLMLADTVDMTEYPSSPAFVTSARPGARKRTFTYWAIGGIVAATLVSAGFLIPTVEAPPVSAVSRTPVTTPPRAAELPPDMPSVANSPQAPAAAATSSARVAPKPSTGPRRSPVSIVAERVAFRTASMASAASSGVVPPPLPPVSVPPPTSSSRTILEQMGGNDRWPNSDNVSTP